MITVETTLAWLGLFPVFFDGFLSLAFPALLPVAPTAFTPMQKVHEMREHRLRLRWYTSGFL